MPARARQYDVDKRTDLEQSLDGGTRFMQDLWEEWVMIPDSTQRLKFTISSYNCGLYHVQNAQTLTKNEGGDPLPRTTRWRIGF